MADVRDLKLIFLGTGTSGGIPIIACDCAACTSDDPRDKRTRTGAAVTWTDPAGQERLVLIDATPDLRLQALRHDLRRCDAILFTHHHVDHTFGLDEVRRFNAVMRAPIDVYAEPRVWKALRRVYKHVFEQEKNVNKSFVATLLPREIAELPYEGGAAEPIDLFGVRFTPVRLLHGNLPVLGYRIEVIRRQDVGGSFPAAWCTDVSAVPPKSWEALTGLGTLCLDGLRPRKHPTHMSIDEACGVASRTGAVRTYLIHIAHEVVHGEVEPTLPDGVLLGYDGLVVGESALEGNPPESDAGVGRGGGV